MPRKDATALKMPAFKGNGRRIPKNNKYDTVTGKVDSGSSISKLKARAEYLAANYRYKKGEIFKRMRASTLAQLIIEAAEATVNVDLDGLDDAASFAAQSAASQPPVATSPEMPEEDASGMSSTTARSTLLGVIHGVGALDVDARRQLPPLAMEKPPFIVLDLRDPDEYEACHIRGAANFHHVRLSRAQNYWTPQVFEYINKPDRIIILYDEDEGIAHKAATTIVQRGINNVFMLSGGLKVFADKIPQGLIVGLLPQTCRPKLKLASNGKEVKNRDIAAPVAALTRENIALIRGQLEELVERTGTSIASGSVSSRTTARSTAPSRCASRAKSVASQKSWR